MFFWKELYHVNKLNGHILQIEFSSILQYVFEQELLTLAMYGHLVMHVHYEAFVSYELLVTKQINHQIKQLNDIIFSPTALLKKMVDATKHVVHLFAIWIIVLFLAIQRLQLAEVVEYYTSACSDHDTVQLEIVVGISCIMNLFEIE